MVEVEVLENNYFKFGRRLHTGELIQSSGLNTFLNVACRYQATFILIPEKREQWSNIAVRRGDPVYLNLTNDLDIINPVWTVKARSSFLPSEYDNFSDVDVFFTIVRMKNGLQVDRLKRPWTVPIAPANSGLNVPLKQVEHSFIMSGHSAPGDTKAVDEFYEHVFDEDSTYQLEIVTTESDAVSISLSISAYSDLSLKGIIMAGVVLVFLYVLIIFEVVHRTLAAMIGAAAAISCLTLIRDVSSSVISCAVPTNDYDFSVLHLSASFHGSTSKPWHSSLE